MAATREVTVALRLQSQMQQARRDLEEIAARLEKVGQAGREAGEQTRLDRIGQEAANAARVVDAARASVDRLAQGVNAAASAGGGPSPFVVSLREQITLFGKGTEDVLRYRAAQAGVGAEAAPLILQLQNMRVAQEAAARAALEEANAQRQAAAARQAATAQADAFIATLREQVALQGKSNADVLRYRAGTLGVGSQAEQYIAEIERLEGASARGGKTLNRFGVTAGQTAAAMRMLPAQITDITTSIASGMPVWMVAIQQGGQIKDSFGGWRAAGDALLSVFTPLRLVMGGLGVAVGVAVAAMVAGQRDVAAFNAAVQTTGNYAGATRGQIEQLAESAARSGGITRGAAREAAVAMVQSGRLGIQTIGNLTRVVQDYANVTGQSTAAAAKSLTDMFVKPGEGAEKLNEQFHFVTLEQLRYIRQLEEQGRVEEARLELSQRFAQHLGGTFVNNLGYLERAWVAVGNAISGAWTWLKKWGAEDTLEARIESQRAAVAALQQAVEKSRGFGGFSPAQPRLEAAQRHLAELEAQRDAEQRKAATDAEQAQLEQRRIDLDKKLKSLAETLKSNREKIEDEKKLLDDALKLGVVKQAEYDKLLAALKEKYRDRTPRAKADPVTSAFEQQKLALTQQLAVEQQKLANTVFGVGSSQETATAKLEAWLATSGKAEQLDASRTAELRKLATELDRVAAEQDRVTEADKRRERIETGMAAVDAQLAQAAGRSADAAALEIQQRFRKLREDLAAAGDTEGLIKVDKLIDMSKARAQLKDLQAEVDLIFGAQSREQQTLQAEMQVGLVGEIDGRERLLEIQRSTAQAVDALLPRMRALAQLTGDPQLAAGVADLEARVGQLKLRADDLQMSFSSAFQEGLGDALSDLAEGTKSLGDAVRGFISGLSESMARFAADKLAAQTTNALIGGVDQTLQAVQSLVPAFGQAATAKIAADQVMTASGVAATTASAAAATAAGAEVAAANAPAAAATATWSWGAAAAAGLAALVAIYALAKGFDRGGYTGHGGKHQPAGIVHAGEVVVRQEVVRQPGMLPLLLDVNKRGKRALRDWPGFAAGGLALPALHGWSGIAGGFAGFAGGDFAGYAGGGLVDMPAATNTLTSLQLAPAAPAAPSSVENRIAVANFVDREQLADWLAGSTRFRKVLVNTVIEEGQPIQAGWSG
ncbi:MAG: phage tail length tape measure family protein [Burkholderiaceae bacterium]|nr:phage tail length tape measure family protein [Burkholderiaceae bacterium]